MITEIDFDKYIVIKIKDLNYLNKDEQKYFADSIRKIDSLRMEKENKPINKYLVLNINDEIDIDEFLIKIPKLDIIEIAYSEDLKISEIALAIVNSIKTVY